MRFQRALYNLALPLAAGAARLAAPLSSKIAEGMEGRKGFRRRWVDRAGSLKRTGPVLWFHVSSVGEFEQAKPVMDILAGRLDPQVEIAITFFSPSGMNYYRRFDRSKRNPAVRIVDYLPVDTIRNMRFCLETLKPDIVVYVKFDLWPNLILEADRMEIPQILISATLSPGSRRLSRLARGFYGSLYGRLTAIAAISDEDAGRFRRNIEGGAEIITAGDTRFDQVCRRIDTSSVALPAALDPGSREFIIAGSTWPKDEAVVIPGYRTLLESFPDVGLIIVPHEPTAERLTEIEQSLSDHGLPSIRLSQLEGRSGALQRVIVADGLGYLAELYRKGILAYVGGSFTTGVHNVMEPAVLGLPVMFGPRIDNSFEAGKLVELGAGHIVSLPDDFTRSASALLSDRDLLQREGETGRGFIRNHCGAALHCIDLIDKYLPTKG